MSGSVEIATWIHEYELRALEKYLAMEGTDTEQVMQKMLAELYSDRVPLEERQAIQKRIETERAEQLARQMANTTWTAYHVTGHGVERYFKTATADQLLHTAMRLRTYLSEEANPHPDSFVGRFRNQQPITKEEFDQMVAQRLENTGRVSGVFDLDFDKELFSAVSTMDGWHTYRMHDVSIAAYHAFRKQELSTDQRWERLLNKLDGKELTPDSEPPVLYGSRRFRLEELALEHEINELDNRLTFYLLPSYDPEAVFGLRVAEADNDDFLTACAVYDLDTGEVCSSLSVFHDRGVEGELEYQYPLTVHEQMVLSEKMDAICIELNGVHLAECRAHYLSEMQGPAVPQL